MRGFRNPVCLDDDICYVFYDSMERVFGGIVMLRCGEMRVVEIKITVVLVVTQGLNKPQDAK